MWATLAASAVLAAAPADAGQLQIKNDRFTHGIYGSERKDAQIIPGDILWVAFDVEGLKVADDGKVSYSTAMELLDKDGKSQFKENPVGRDSVNTLGGTRLPVWSRVSIGTDTPAGEYTVRITLADQAAKDAKPATLERKFTVVAPRFGLILTAFGYDKPATAPPPAPPVAVPGQQLLTFFTVVGFDTKPGKTPKDPLQADVAVEMSILDESGKPTLTKPFTGEIKEVTEDYKTFLPFQFPILMNRPGKYTVVLTATDKQGNKPPVKQELQLTVVDVK